MIGDKNKSGLIFLAATALLPKSSLRFFLARLAGFVMKQMEDEEPIEDKEMAFLNPSPLVDGSLRFNTNAKRERSDNIVKFLRGTGASLQAQERFGGGGIDPVLPARPR